MPIQSIQRDGRHGQPHCREVGPRPTTEQTHCQEPHHDPQQRHFVGRPSDTHLSPASRNAQGRNGNRNASSLPPTSYVCSDTYRLIRHSCPGSTPAKSFICRHLLPLGLVSFSALCASKRRRGSLSRKTHWSRTLSCSRAGAVRRRISRTSANEIYGRIRGRVFQSPQRDLKRG